MQLRDERGALAVNRGSRGLTIYVTRPEEPSTCATVRGAEEARFLIMVLEKFCAEVEGGY